ncbi:hypothetical protein EV122DRAFT_273495 [Schizophyllum commune]|nr:hypothetical protein K525DRAFT_240725 [Schizophyllum commune Loenen D]
MKTATFFASLVAFVGATALVQDSGYPDCEPTTGSFHIPDKITVGKSFAVRFCSSTYFKTSTKSITLAIGLNSTSVDGAVVLTQELHSKDGKTYDFEATVPNSAAYKFSDKSSLIVVEKIHGYYVSENYQVTTKKAHIVYPESYAGESDFQVLISAGLD